ncbi:MAG TPA: hypothetical protein PK771_05980 [Spirochaetota bacterium]|nr:hypothetical protein [Spirochaetota bacterium]
MYRIEVDNCDCHPEICSCSSYLIFRGNKIIASGNNYKEMLALLSAVNVNLTNISNKKIGV